MRQRGAERLDNDLLHVCDGTHQNAEGKRTDAHDNDEAGLRFVRLTGEPK